MISRLHIQTEWSEQRTHLRHAFFTPPFKVADITEDKKANLLKLMLMSSSPGVLDNDAYDQRVDVGSGCEVELQTQSFQRIFTMKQSASQKFEVNLKEGASFLYLPHPVVPHRDSDFSSHNKIFLSENCSLIWGEVLTCGRKLNGEVFQFSRYHNLTEVFLHGKLVIRENLLIKPQTHAVHAIGYLEEFTHQASLIYVNPDADMNALNEIVTQLLQHEKEIIFGVTAAPIHGLVIRVLGQHAEQLHECLKKIAALLPRTALKKEMTHAG